MESYFSGLKLFLFYCGQSFRRDEIVWYFKNVYNEIYSGLNGVMEKRCFFVYLGCSFIYRKFVFFILRGKIIYSFLLGSFGFIIGEENEFEIIECIDDLLVLGNKDLDKIRRFREVIFEIVTFFKYDFFIKVILRFR